MTYPAPPVTMTYPETTTAMNYPTTTTTMNYPETTTTMTYPATTTTTTYPVTTTPMTYPATTTTMTYPATTTPMTYPETTTTMTYPATTTTMTYPATTMTMTYPATTVTMTYPVVPTPLNPEMYPEKNSNLTEQQRNISKSIIPVFNEHHNQLKDKANELYNTGSGDGPPDVLDLWMMKNVKTLSELSKNYNELKDTFKKLQDQATSGIKPDSKKQFPEPQEVKGVPYSMKVMNEKTNTDKLTMKQDGEKLLGNTYLGVSKAVLPSDDDVTGEKQSRAKVANEDMPQEFHEIIHKRLVQPTNETPHEKPTVLSREDRISPINSNKRNMNSNRVKTKY